MKRSEILKLRHIIEMAVQSLSDATSLEAIVLHPEWTINTSYAAGFKVQCDKRLFKALQAHTSQSGWEPTNATSLWVEINEVCTGTADNPIPYNNNMALESGKYYSQNNIIYLCIRDTGNPVYNNLIDLVGLYVENVVTDD